MADDSHKIMTEGPLAGARIWLSGSIPKEENVTDDQRAGIENFVRRFALEVFRRGGHIIHGSHPTFSKPLREAVQAYREVNSRNCLILVFSEHFSEVNYNEFVNEWQNLATVYKTPAVSGADAREKSLQLLREWMVARCDAIVAVGGKWWKPDNERAGVPVELQLAIDRGLPCFLLSGLGGAAQEYLKQHPDVLYKLKNGLDQALNQWLSTQEDVASLAQGLCDHLERLPLVHGRGSDGASFRILALDGGGLKGAFTASALDTWEKLTGRRIIDHFDLIAGTSTGGIIAIGLGLGLTAEQMLEFYRDCGPVIFPVTRFRSRVFRTLKHVVRPKYAQTVLHQELQNAFRVDGRQPRLKNSKCRLVIPSYYAAGGESHIFRTPHHPGVTGDAETEAADVALATASAPTFFTAAKIANMVAENSYFDGGVWANSPAMAAIVEATCFLGIPLERLEVLSVGTTDEPFTVQPQSRAGIIGWLRKGKILDLLMNVQQESSLKLARQLVSKTRFHRVNKTTVPGRYSLDGPNQIEELAGLGNTEASKPEVFDQVRSRFLNGIPVLKWESYARDQD